MIKDFTDKVYILEGPDGSGKSTLGKKLKEAFDTQYVHLTYYKDEEVMRTQFYDVIRRINTEKKGCVIDRFILSNIVYGIVFHNCKFVEGWKMFMDAMCRDWIKGKEIIICLPYDKKAYLEHFKKMTEEREEMYCSVEDMSKIYDLYEVFYEILSHNPKVNVSRYDWMKIKNTNNYERIPTSTTYC